MKMKFFKLLKDVRGFSLAEITIAAGMLGALSLAVMQVTKTQIKSEKNSIGNLDINTSANTVTQLLVDEKSCTNTLKTGPNVVVDGMTINSIRNRSNIMVYEIGTEFSDGMIVISDISIEDFDVNTIAGPTDFGEGNLVITYEKTSKVLKTGGGDNKRIKRKFPIKLEVNDGTGELVKCISAVDNAIVTSKIESCEGIGGNYNMAIQRCEFDPFDPAVYGYPTGGVTALRDEGVSTEHLHNFKSVIIENEYVNTAGDTMTGKLVVMADINPENYTGSGFLRANDTISTETRFCVDGRCRDFNEELCPNRNEVAWKINEDGSVDCRSIGCPANTFFVGLNIDGSVHCKSFTPQDCPPKHYLSEVRNDGSAVCSPLPVKSDKNCPDDSMIRRVDATGVVHCEVDKSAFSKSCTGDNVLVGFRDDGSIICEDPTPTINGGWSGWSSWSSCSKNCNSGIQTRSRTCDNPIPENGGSQCSGPSEETRSCNTQDCCSDVNWWSIEKHEGTYTCAFLKRYMINNDAASKQQICVERGFDYAGPSVDVFSHSDWCGYCNARTTSWTGSSWDFHGCTNSSIEKMECCYNE